MTFFKIKFIYSEKATKFYEISTLLLSYVVPVNIKVELSQNFVAFSEYMNSNQYLSGLAHISGKISGLVCNSSLPGFIQVTISSSIELVSNSSNYFKLKLLEVVFDTYCNKKMDKNCIFVQWF